MQACACNDTTASAKPAAYKMDFICVPLFVVCQHVPRNTVRVVYRKIGVIAGEPGASRASISVRIIKRAEGIYEMGAFVY